MGQASTCRTATRGQSDTIGVVLLLALTITAASAVVALGGAALTDMQRESKLQRAEHVMTQLDSHAAEVALGGSDVQTVDFGRLGGDYVVRPNAGTITVTHVNFDGASSPDSDEVDDGPSDDDEQVYSDSLGAVVYRNGETLLAYQGGGVWRDAASGQSRMIAPPEFHYRAGTLTLPVVRTTGTASASGDVTAPGWQWGWLSHVAGAGHRSMSYASAVSLPYVTAGLRIPCSAAAASTLSAVASCWFSRC